MLANACGPCIGQWKRDDIAEGEENSIINSYNRNFRKRNDGNTGTYSFIASPEVVVAYALAGTLEFDPLNDEISEAADGKRFKLEPPAPAPEIPRDGFVESRRGLRGPAGRRQRGRGGGRPGQRAARRSSSPSRPGTARLSSAPPCC